MDIFRVDPVIESLLRGMTQDELKDFTTRHNNPTEDADIEISIYAMLNLYTRFGSNEAREGALQRANNWLAETQPNNPDYKRRCKILEAIGSSTVQGSRDIGMEGSLRAEKLFADYSQSGKEDKIKLDLAIVDMMTSVAYTPVGHPDRAARLAFLGNLHGIRYRDNGKYDGDLAMAITYLEMAVDCTAPDNTHGWMWLANLSTVLGDRYKCTRELSDLNEAIVVAEKGLLKLPANHTGSSPCAILAASWLGERYRIRGALTDLNRLVELSEIDLTRQRREPGPAKTISLINLATWLGKRFDRVGSMADVNRAVEMAEEALELAPLGSVLRANVLLVLGVTRALRSSRAGQFDNKKAIEFTQQAVDLTDPQDPNLGLRLVHLGTCYITRFQLGTGGKTDLDLAIESIQRAVTLGSPSLPELATWQDNLSLAYSLRGKITKNVQDFDKAVELAEAAYDALPKTHHMHISAVSNLAFRFMERYEEFHHEEDAERAIQGLKMGWECSDGSLAVRIQSAEQVGKLLASQGKWIEAYNMLRKAVLKLPKISPRVMQPKDKQHILALTSDVTSTAAAVALQAGANAYETLELIETGRGIISRSIQDMRADLSELALSQPHLAKRFEKLRRKMEAPHAFKDISFTNLKPNPTSESIFKEARDAEGGFEELLEEIRACEGFEGFLGPPSPTDIKHAGDKGPVVTLNISEYRCDAIIISKGVIKALPLPHLTVDGLKKHVGGRTVDTSSERLFGVRDVYSSLEWLWDVAAGPILNDLCFNNPASLENPPRVWWIPTGLLTRLPIHAAGYYRNGSGDTVLDRVASSYGTSVRALISERSHKLECLAGLKPDGNAKTYKAVLVAMNETPGARSLPFASVEVGCVEKILLSIGFNIERPLCRKFYIMKQLETCTVFHFAGHGKSDARDPSRSCLLLDDWQADLLTLDDLRDCWALGPSSYLDWADDLTDNRQRTRDRNSSPFLAYLSACSSGLNKVNVLSDEDIHLAGALKIAGFRHVIACL